MTNAVLGFVALAGLLLAGCTTPSPASSDTMMAGDHMGTGTGSMMAQTTLHAQLHAYYADHPYLAAGAAMGTVDTPAHEWKSLPDGRQAFLHWDNADPMKAEKLLFIGDTLPGPMMGCIGTGGITQAQIDAGYTHFHKLHAASFDAGHHMDPADPHIQGYWLRHMDANTGAIFHGLDSTSLPGNPLKAC